MWTPKTLALFSLVIAAACSERPHVDVEPVTTSYMKYEVRFTRPIRVDLLFVIDNTRTMVEEQDTLRAELPLIIRDLLDPPIHPETGVWEHIPVQDIHVGVVSTDMGCRETERGDYGILLGDAPSRYLEYESRRPDPGAVESMVGDIGRISSLGTDGCGIEQPLEAALAALTVHAQPGGLNEGFLREDSMLHIIFITDEDDCSVRDPLFFELIHASPELACTMYPEMLQPLDRYVEEFRALRNHPDELHLSFIAGVPFGPQCEGFGDEIPTCTDHPDMAIRLESGFPSHLAHSCISSAGQAYPSRRLVQLAQAFGDSALVQSICLDSYLPAIRPLTYHLHCLDWGWNWYFPPWRKDPDDPCRCVAPCTLIEHLEGAVTCPEGKTRLFPDPGSGVLCTIPQAGIRLEVCDTSCFDRAVIRTRDGEGWAYGTGVVPCNPWDFSEGLEPEEDSTVFIDCKMTLCPDHRACGPEYDPGSVCCPAGHHCEEGICTRNPE